MDEKHFLTQKVTIKKKYSNKELKLHHFFYDKTNLYPENVLVHKHFVFFFVKTTEYFKSKRYLKSIRKELIDKVLIIRAENTLIKLILGFFPDTYVHEITLDKDSAKKIIVNLYFIFYEDRGIAIGRKGEYIKLINEIFENYINLEKYDDTIEIKCNFLNLW